MKKILLLVAAISLSSCSTLYKSYPVSDVPKDNDKTTIYYNIPQTEVLFEVKVNKTIRQKGIFANQSNLLGLKNVITSDEVKYSVKDVKITSREVEDPDQQYALLLNDNKVKVNKSEIGTLTQIFKQDGKYGKVIDLSNRILRVDGLGHKNNEHFNNSTTAQTQQTQPLSQTKQIFESRLQEKGMLEKTNLTAEEVVNKIEQLREKQIDILSGNIDGTYMNTTVDFMYKQLDEIIDGYVSLFTGTETTVEETYYYTLNPKKPIISEEDLILKLTDSPIPLLARFHTRDVAKEIMMSGTETTKSNSVKAISDSPKVITLKEKSEGINGVYYSIPEMVEVSVETPNKTYRKSLQLVQYGAIKTFNSKNYDIEFDPKTGAIKSISRI
jgi:hypothetical protein